MLRTSIILIACVVMLPLAAIGQPVVYVDVDAPGPVHDGASWATALTDLQDALAIAGDGTEIRMAAGVYKPDGGSGARTATFRLRTDLVLRGSYAGYGEPVPDARDVASYTTILSGDLNDDDTAHFANFEENAYHVVSTDGTNGTAVLDGLVIIGGNADGDDSAGNGGGILCDGTSLTLVDCTFVSSMGTNGAGIYISAGSYARLLRCTLEYNKAVVHGGGVCNDGGVAMLDECVFRTNQVAGDLYSQGGALYVNGGGTSLTNCQFVDGNYGRYGGVAFIDGSATVIATGCIFRDNWAQQIGGGIYSLAWGGQVVVRDCVFDINRSGGNGGAFHLGGNSPYRVTDSTFIGNSSSFGGAMMISGHADPWLERCRFLGNSADDGGAIYTRAQDATTANCVFSGNSADRGGAVFDPGYPGSSHMKMVNCSFAGNEAIDGRAIATALGPYDFVAVNCVLWDDGPNEINVEGSGTLTITHSTVRGGWTGTGNLALAPQFEDAGGADGTPGTEDDDLRLQPGSPCIDAGDNAVVPAGVVTDLDSHPRFWDDPDTDDTGTGKPPVVDMGAYEFGATGCVDADGDGMVEMCESVSDDSLEQDRTVTVPVERSEFYRDEGYTCGRCVGWSLSNTSPGRGKSAGRGLRGGL